MSQQTMTPHGQESPPDGPPPARRRPRGADHSAARNFSRGFLVKLALVALVDAGVIYGLLASIAVQQWAIAAFLLVAAVAVNWAYFSRRALAAKYLVPGLIFLFVYVIFTAGYTAYVAFTNYGDGHNSTQTDAVAAILAQTEQRVEGSASYPLTVVSQDGDLGFAIVRDGQAEVGTADEPLAGVDGASVEGDKVTGAPGWEVLDFASVAQRQEEIVNLRVPVSDDPADGSLRTQDGSTGYIYESTMVYDAAADTMTDTATGVVYTADDHGNFRSADGDALTPGWKVFVGFENFSRAFTDSRLTTSFVEILVWNFAFAILSVVLTFAAGLFLAVVFNDPRVRGQKLIRSLFILPYAFPAFLSALVWKGMLNKDGIVNHWLFDSAIPWLTDPTLAKVSILLVNLWLGFPYMFIVCTGALQSIPSDALEAARMDGASPWRIQRAIVLPLLMVSVAPLLVASFAFNFNNFALIYMLTGGGPNFVGTPVVIGHTDILITMVYSVAFESGLKQYGFAAALSIIIFLIVGGISWWGFRRTRRLEDLA